MEDPVALQLHLVPAAPIAPESDELDFFAGWVSGVASLLCGHPFDTVKVRLQCQEKDRRTYRNALHAFTSIVREERIAGLYKGVLSPMLGVAAVNASVFGFYKTAMRLQLPSPDATPTLLQVTIAGTASGLFTSFLTAPIERLKILQQASPSNRPQPSLVHLLRTTANTPQSLYRGLGATLWRDSAYGPYFATYEFCCRVGIPEEERGENVEKGWTRLLIAGGAAGVVGWGTTFAMDVVKTRIQSSDPYLPPKTPGGVRIPHPYRTTWSTITNSYRAEGWKVFTAGLGPTLLRAIPVNMVCFFVFEFVVSSLR